MRIYIIGYMGSGKSTVSEKLAKKLELMRFDLDELFEQRFKVDISRFFEKYDEPLFRKLESRLLKETVLLNNVVISTGGGTPCFYDNMEWMKQSGTTVYLEMSPKSLVTRLQSSKRKRPLMRDKTAPEQLLEYITSHLRQRNIWYSQADIIIKGESIDLDELANRVLAFRAGNKK
jgi:shikimate kinase